MGRKTVTEKFDPFIQLLVTVVKFHTFTTRLNFKVKLMPLILNNTFIAKNDIQSF